MMRGQSSQIGMVVDQRQLAGHQVMTAVVQHVGLPINYCIYHPGHPLIPKDTNTHVEWIELTCIQTTKVSSGKCFGLSKSKASKAKMLKAYANQALATTKLQLNDIIHQLP